MLHANRTKHSKTFSLVPFLRFNTYEIIEYKILNSFLKTTLKFEVRAVLYTSF